ncbi:MAG: flotillin-like protein FloA [Candidatus Poribacteria bacterium]|nr:flotillin-like protein FloA [Candidatus Poribacteria bacterium]
MGGIFAVLFVILLLFGVAVLNMFVPLGLWIAAQAAGVKVRVFGDLVAMRLRRVPQRAVVEPQIAATKAGLDLDLGDLEAHLLAGGRVDRVVEALISADKAQIPLTFERAAAIDLAGRDVLEAVGMSITPKVIETPKIAAVAKNGIQLIVTARVTVRANIERLVGGAGEETVIARVGQGIITTIGSSETHSAVQENPESISKRVLEAGLATGTAFEILSIDIADIDVGENVGAKLQRDRAEAQLKIARAKAEERRAEAQAREQEMKAIVEMKNADLVEAEAEVPRAIAAAFEAGTLGVEEYYRIRNLMADTEMRQAIASGADESGERREYGRFSG